MTYEGLEENVKESIRVLESARRSPGLLVLDTGALIWLEQFNNPSIPGKQIDIAADAARAQRAVAFLDYMLELVKSPRNLRVPLRERIYITDEVASEYTYAIDSFIERAHKAWDTAEMRATNERGEIKSYMPAQKAQILDNLALALEQIATKRKKFVDTAPRVEDIIPCWDFYETVYSYLGEQPSPVKPKSSRRGLPEHADHDNNILSKAVALQRCTPVNLLTTDEDIPVRHHQLYSDHASSPVFTRDEQSYGLRVLKLRYDWKKMKNRQLRPKFCYVVTTEDMPTLYATQS